ncbi:DNA polymerase III subunit psi [Psychromonas sp. RZ22]|uniref:DNA polymerase III subunit psi n=1 Tax=Psychromonas algarum TaxID=2555643 RepID=UPI00106757D8|nr:DNA polymerase III subunit psi [Psychromonas sp. RZ22]TEW54629.1 DNA polymerase III subunit psi [Psychromonas sp. RZ22]
MKHSQAIFLQEMGISHWQVRKPTLFKVEEELKKLKLSTCKLLVICTEQDKKHALMPAIINAFSIEQDSVSYCSLAQFENHQGTLPQLIWSTLGKVEIDASHQVLHSLPLEQLAKHKSAKKSLWKQFCATQQ